MNYKNKLMKNKKRSIIIILLMIFAPQGFAQAWNEVTKITGSEALTGENFGASVSIDGDYAIVGVPGSDLSFMGSAYVYEKVGDDWVEVQELIASDGNPGDNFGYSVSIHGDYAVVGASWSNSEEGWDIGAAYIYERNDAGTWIEVQKIGASDGVYNDSFGWTVNVNGTTMAIGAPITDEGSTDAGSTYMFERGDDGTWSEVQKLMASDPEPTDWFGYSVSIDEDYLIIGCILSDDDGDGSGSAYIFERDDEGVWIEVEKITASDAGESDWFGNVVSLSGDHAIVGRWINTDGTEMGSAYIYERSEEGAWEEIQKLTPLDAAESDGFGLSVSIDGDYAIVGAAWSDNDSLGSGSAYVFERNEDGLWVEIEEITASDKDVNDRFGYSVSLSYDHAIVGASFNDDDGENSGSAYIIKGCFPFSVEIISDDTTLCEGGMVTLNGSGAVSYEWSGGVEDGVAFEPPVGETTYSVIGTNEYDCSSTDSILITVFESPEVEFTALEDELVCLDNGLITLTGTPADGDFSGTGITGSEFDPNAAGEGTHTLFYSYVDENGCSGTDSVEISVTDCLGMNEAESLSFNIYPNPFSDFAVIQFNQELSADHQVVIHNALGQEVWRKENLNGSQIIISKEELETGVYLFTLIESGNKLLTNKLIVK